MLSSRSLTLRVLAFAATPALLLAGCDRQTGEEAQPAPAASGTGATSTGAGAPAGTADRGRKGAPLPALSFTDPAGRTLAMPSLKGRPVLVNLWATWCAPCVKELPALDAVAAAGKVRVVTISQDSGEPAAVTRFLADKGVKRLEPWLDPQNEASFHYGTGTLPTSVLYDAQGREVWRFTGENDWTSPAAAALLAEAG